MNDDPVVGAGVKPSTGTLDAPSAPEPDRRRRGPTARELGLNPRALGVNPRALGVNPRAYGANPRALARRFGAEAAG